MKILFPPAKGRQAQRVNSWREIKKDARKMSELIRKDGFAGRLWKSMYAMAHPQLMTLGCDETNPRCRAGECGHHKRFFVLNWQDAYVRQQFKHEVFINPVVLFAVDSIGGREGCASNEYAGTVNVMRPNKIKVEYFVPGWFGLRKVREDFSGLAARVVQHEIDHLNGIYL